MFTFLNHRFIYNNFKRKIIILIMMKKGLYNTLNVIKNRKMTNKIQAK